MRLTPSWLRSSSDTPPDECSGDGETTAGPQVPIYHESRLGIGGVTDDDDDDEGADEFVPESDATLLSVLDEMERPVTVDEITDRLIEPAQPPIETWAGVHERLHQTRLPALDEDGEIEFDDTQGIVERSDPPARERNLFSPAVLGTVSVLVFLAVVTLVSVSMITALTVTLLTTTFAIWFVPSFV